MTVAFAAIHERLRYRGEDTGLHLLAFTDGQVFISRDRPRLYDAAARAIPSREVLPGTYVNVRYREQRQRKLIEAIQLVRLPPEEESPFRPVLDDGHL
jgi:hypothetical protein